jgi:hypothetical protein
LNPATSSLGLAFPSEFDRDRAPAPFPEPAGSREVSALSALEEAGVYFPGECLSPGMFRLQGFTPSWRFPPPESVRACFIPMALLGFVPFEASLAGDRRHLVGVGSTRLPLLSARLPGLDPSGSSSPALQGLACKAAPGFPGFRPSRGLVPRDVRLSRVTLPRAWRRLRKAVQRCSTECVRRSGWQPHREAAAPPGVSRRLP